MEHLEISDIEVVKSKYSLCKEQGFCYAVSEKFQWREKQRHIEVRALHSVDGFASQLCVFTLDDNEPIRLGISRD